MTNRTPALVNGGGRSFWLPLSMMALTSLAALGALVVVSQRGPSEWSEAGAVDDGTAMAGGRLEADKEAMLSIEDVTLVLERHRDRLMQLPGVIGLYVGADHQSSLVLRVILLHGFAGTREQLPAVLDGVPVDVEESEPIKPL